MRALLARRVDIAWLLLVAALSGAVLVLWLAMQSAATPGGSVYIVRAATTPVVGQGGAPAGQEVAGTENPPVPSAPMATPQLTSERATAFETITVTGTVNRVEVNTVPTEVEAGEAVVPSVAPDPTAEPGALDLAQPLQDGNTIPVPHSPIEQPVGAKTSTPAPAAPQTQVADYPTAPELPAGTRIDINSATARELEALPGIGPVLAGRIVQDREANGPFATVYDLKRIKGIGDGIVAKVRDHVTTGR